MPDVAALIYETREPLLKELARELELTYAPLGRTSGEFSRNGKAAVNARADENGMRFEIGMELGERDAQRIKDALSKYTPEGNRFSYHENKETREFHGFMMKAGRFASWSV